jgi:oligo-1,6-glucosidase
MRGTPYCYYGDELAMTNSGFSKIEDYKDMPTLNEYQHQKNIGGDINKFMKSIQFNCRDNGRTPMQWDSTSNAGFTIGTPWLKTNPNYTLLNVSAQEKDPNSCLNYFKNMVKLRKENLAFVYGKYTLLDKANPDVYAYTREMNGKKFLVLLNFTDKQATVKTGIDISSAKVLINNYTATAASETLKPYEAFVIQL